MLNSNTGSIIISVYNTGPDIKKIHQTTIRIGSFEICFTKIMYLTKKELFLKPNFKEV